MTIQHIDVSLIRQDGGTQARASMTQEAIDEYALAMAEGKEFPAVTVFYDGGAFWLGDGFHRVAAHIKAFGFAPIQAEVHDGTQRDALLFATGANADHGVRRTVADKRRAVSVLLDDPEWAKWSDREIARRVDVSHTFVANLRTDRSQGGNVATLESNNHIHKDEVPKIKPAPETSHSGSGDTDKAPEKNDIDPLAPTRTPAPIASPKPAPTPEPMEDVAPLKAQVEDLKAKVSDLQSKLCEAGCQVQELHEENESLHQILDAEDLLAAFKKEVLSAQERARVAESQRNGVMVENRDLAGRLKSALRKIENLQKKAPEAPEEVAS